MFGTSAVGETAASTILTRLRDRRRPGRMDYSNPDLVALLRDASNPADTQDPADSSIVFPSEDALGPARGIALGVIISGLAWAVIVGSIWALLCLQG